MSKQVFAYVERRFTVSGCTEWPTVREVARALRMRQAEVEDEVDGDERLFLSYFRTQVFVEIESIEDAP